MSHLPSKTLKTRLTVGRIVLIYFTLGSAWIVLSSLWLSQQDSDSVMILVVEAFKGLSYVVVTSILLWILCRSWSRQVTDALTRHQQSESKLLMLNAMLRAIRRVNKAIVSIKEIDPLIQQICEILIEDREFKHAWIVLLDEKGQVLHEYDAPERKGSEQMKKFLQAGKLGSCTHFTQKGDRLTLAANPMQQCPDFPAVDGLEDCTLIGIEFNYDQKSGYIVLMASQAVLENNEEVDLFREVAEDLRFGLHSIQAEQERKRMTEDLLVAKQAAENANRAKDEFLSVMSHELRTPLNPIMGHTTLLMEEIQDTGCLDSLEEIYHSSEKLLTLINDILFFSQLQEGTETAHNIQFNLLEICESALDRCRSQYPKQAIHFENGLENYQAVDLKTEVRGDLEYLERILGGLLCNACKYTHEGEIHLRVGQREIEPGKVDTLFEVEDSGIGIKKEVLQRIFDPFTQLDSSNTRRYRGVGLGLAICRKIADVMGGSLTAESQPGVGSCFRFSCTLEIAPDQETVEPDLAPEQASEDAPCGRVLLVEDNTSNALIARTMLRRLGIEVDWAEHGQSAIEMCGQNSYELILMDLSMPVMNGFDATKIIRNADTPNRETPIIGLTAHVSPHVEKACYEAGMAGFVAKPIRVESFKSCLSKYLQLV